MLGLPWHRRRLAVMSAVAAVAMGAGALTGLQIRAAQADERRETAVAAQVAEREQARLRADIEARRVAHVETVLAWAKAAQQGSAAVAEADTALAGSEGKVADDTVRQDLAALAAELRAAVDDPPDSPSDDDVAALVATTGQVTVATVAVVEAQAAWQAEQDAPVAAVVEDEAPAWAPRGWPYDGAGPDCGSPESYQPSEGALFHTSVPADDGDGSNGNLPRSAMTALPWCVDALGNQQWLRTDAADALVALNEAFRAQFGENIAVDLSYRSYADQAAMRQYYGGLAARPGTSNHGLGTAIDTWEWATYSFGTPRFDWLVANGPSYGWVCPAAQPGSANPEYWHFEYVG